MTTDLLRVSQAERRRRWRMLLGPATDDVATGRDPRETAVTMPVQAVIRRRASRR